MSIILTIDVEEWYHLNYPSMAWCPGQPLESRVQANTETLLRVLAEYKSEATFFFLGCVAKQYPSLVSAAQASGHEIASHGYAHQLVYKQSRDEFRADVKQSLDILQAITGQVVKGYRAPSWSISPNTPWFYEVLADLGLTYSSSLFPFTTYLYGDSNASIRPFAQQIGGHKFYEIPATVLKLGRFRFPFGGGFYFRTMPYWLTRLATCLTAHQERPVVFYLHPREVDPDQPRLALPPLDSFVSYAGLKTTMHKLRRMLSNITTITMNHYLESRKVDL